MSVNSRHLHEACHAREEQGDCGVMINEAQENWAQVTSTKIL